MLFKNTHYCYIFPKERKTRKSRRIQRPVPCHYTQPEETQILTERREAVGVKGGPRICNPAQLTVPLIPLMGKKQSDVS